MTNQAKNPANKDANFASQLSTLLAEISLRFVQVSDGPALDNTINEALESIGRFFDLDRAYLFKFSGDLSSISNTHEWCAPGISTQRNRLQQFPTTHLQWWMKRLRELKPLIIENIDSLPAEAVAEKDELLYQEICSLICLPIFDTDSKLIGFMGLDAVRGPHVWTEQNIAMLQTLAAIIGGTIFRVEATRKLAENEQKFRAIVENANDIIYTLTPAGELSYISPNWTDLLGYEVNDFIGKSYEPLIHPDDLAQTRDFLTAVFSTASKQSGVEYRIRHADGSWCWHTSNAAPILDESGKVTAYMGIARDITERKLAEEVLKASEMRFKKILEGVETVSVQGYAMDGTVRYWNRASTLLYGYTGHEAIGRNLLELIIPPAMREAVQAEIRKMAETNQPIAAGELTLMRKDGSSVTVFSSHALIELPCGEKEFFCIDIDLSQRKLLEDALRLMVDKAESANKAKSQFLANMSHEIRTPMNGIIGLTDLLLDSELTEEQRKCAQTVMTCGESLLSIINDILDFSRIEAGKLELEIRNFDLQTLLDDFVALMQTQADKKGLAFSCTIEHDVPTLLAGDSGRLRQILTNLAGNAVKFTHQGEVAVRVSIQDEKVGNKDSCMLRFSVRDTGIGIPQDKIVLLFERFSQVDDSNTRQYGGTGLGLAISKALVELMCGEIGVESSPGHGSEFWFTASFERQNNVQNHFA